jgi:hypothetical protein
VALPAATPVTIPVPDPTVAIALLLLLQLPPPASVSVIVEPGHTLAVPLIAAGADIIVMVAVSKSLPHAFVKLYEIIAVPAATPVAIPEAEPIVVIDVFVLLHIPPLTELVRVVVEPVHKLDAPAMVSTAGKGFIVTPMVAVAEPQLFVYV